MISLPIGDALFNYRVAGVAILSGKVLLHKTPSDQFWSLPGGRAELFEFSKNTLIREMMEETGMHVTVGEMLWVSENFFVYNAIKHHEIGFYFKMDICGLENQSDFLGKEGQEDLLFKWHDLSELHTVKVYPEFITGQLSGDTAPARNFTADFRDLDAF